MDRNRLAASAAKDNSNEASGRLIHGKLSSEVLRCAIRVHSQLGPGLLESAYRTCLAHELALTSIVVRQEVPIPMRYGDASLECGFRADLVVGEAILVELKAVDRLLPIHDAQLLTYLKLTGLRVGLLLNFNAPTMREGIRRLVR